MKKFGLALVFGSALWSGATFAFEPFVVKDIHFEGLQRVSESTIYNYLPFQLGDELKEEDTDAIIRTLFQTGFFQDIHLARKDDDSLVIRFVERAVIGQVDISGNHEIKTQELLESMKAVGIAQGRTFDRALLTGLRNELERLYFSRGKYGVEVEVSVETQPRNRVKVSVDISEGDVARIQDINIVGNQLFDDKTLLKNFSLASKSMFSWFTKADRYAKQRLEADLETLRAFYMDRGYLNFDITSAQVSMTPDKRGIYISINVTEGERFTVGDLSIEGQTVVPTAELAALLKTQTGEVFSRQAITASIKAMAERLGEEGYAFPDIHPVPDVNEANHTVSFAFMITPGQRYYVNQILFTGNDKTQDEVLRREMVQMEGAILSSVKVDDSKRNLDRTGYFHEVSVETTPVSEDEVNLEWDVEEAPSGHFSGGIGYSTAEGMLLNASIVNRNFLGKGETLELDFNRSSTYSTYNLGYTDPYYTPEGISRSYNLYYSETEFSEASNVSDYITNMYGAGITYGIPLTRDSRMTLGLGLRDTDLKVGAAVPTEIDYHVRRNGKHSLEYNLSTGWSYNSFDRYLFPTKGARHSLGANATLPGSDLQYYRLSYNSQLYYPLSETFVGGLTFTAGYGNGYHKTARLPFYQHFFVGGSQTVRGYDESSLGPKDSLGNPFGGNVAFTGSAQIFFSKLWGQEHWRTVRPSLFIDAGQVYNTGKRLTTATGDTISQRNPAGFRFSSGLSVTWVSPMGPLEFSLGYPLNKKAGDELRAFNFSFGARF